MKIFEWAQAAAASPRSTGAVQQDLKGVELVACADIRPNGPGFRGEIRGKAHDSMEAMLEGEQLDVVHLCTPHYLHTPMVKLAVERGLHVFTEKPPVINWEQWRQFQELAKGPCGWVFVQNRYNQSVGMLKDILASGKAGKRWAPELVTWHREAPYYTGKRLAGSLKQRGRGAHQPVHPHPDLLVQFLGGPTTQKPP